MTEVDYKRSEVSTIGAFAKEKGVNGQTLKSAVEKLKIEYVDKIGASHLYYKTDLITAMGTTSQAAKVGYVHPDKYKELQDLHGEAVSENALLIEQKLRLESALEGLQEEYNALVAKFDELTMQNSTDDSVAQIISG